MYITRNDNDSTELTHILIEEVPFHEYAEIVRRIATGSGLSLGEAEVQFLYDNHIIMSLDMYLKFMVKAQLLVDVHKMDNLKINGTSRREMVEELVKQRDASPNEIWIVSYLFWKDDGMTISAGGVRFDPTGTAIANRYWERDFKLRSLGI